MFWNNYFNLCADKGMSANAVAKALGIASGTVTAWKNGRVPHHDTLIKIADYFGVTVDYLLGKEKSSDTKPNATILEVYNDHEKALIEAYRKNPDMQGAVDRLLGIADDQPVLVYRAARSDDHHEDEIVEMSPERLKKLQDAPETDDDLL